MKFVRKKYSLIKIKVFIKKIKIILRIDKIINKQRLIKKNFFQRLCFNYIGPSIEFSYMNKNAKIPPHTDSPSKLISLMLYFPDKDYSESQIEELGTSFYDSKIKNDKNFNIKNEGETEFFSKNSKILTLPFKKRNLYGFIRNFFSWHGVEKINLKENQLRKSINLSLMLY